MTIKADQFNDDQFWTLNADVNRRSVRWDSTKTGQSPVINQCRLSLTTTQARDH